MKLKCERSLTEVNILHLGYQAFKKDKLIQQDFFEVILAMYKHDEGKSQDIDCLEESIESLKTLKFSYAQFARNPFISQDMPRRAVYTFSDWFLSMVTLTESFFKRLWKDGYVIGFIGKELAENLLIHQKEGTFMIRFSDTTIGGVSFPFCDTDEEGLPVV